MRFHTALETKDVRSLRNKILTISYYARKGANYSEANSKITGVRIATGENLTEIQTHILEVIGLIQQPFLRELQH